MSEQRAQGVAIMPCQLCSYPPRLFEADRCWWVVECPCCGSRGPHQNIFQNDGRLGAKLREFKDAHDGHTPGGFKAIMAWNKMQTWIAHGVLLEVETAQAKKQPRRL